MWVPVMKQQSVGPGRVYAAYQVIGNNYYSDIKQSITLTIDRVGYNDTEYAKLIFDPDDSYRVIGPDGGNRSTAWFDP